MDFPFWTGQTNTFLNRFYQGAPHSPRRFATSPGLLASKIKASPADSAANVKTILDKRVPPA